MQSKVLDVIAGGYDLVFREEKLDDLNIEPKFVSNLSSMLKEMVLSGYGITSLPEFTVADEIKQNKLVYVLP